jgi:negative regulator of flagellin synthesis FlgM
MRAGAGHSPISAKDELVKISGGGSVKPVSPAGMPDVAPVKAPGPAGTVAPSPARDKVDITSVSAQLAQLERVLGEVGVVDASRVEAIKLAIAEGRFRIDSDVVADRLLATVREYLASQKA